MEYVLEFIGSIEVALMLFVYGATRFAMKECKGCYSLVIPMMSMVYGIYMCTPDYVGDVKSMLVTGFIIITILFRMFYRGIVIPNMNNTKYNLA